MRLVRLVSYYCLLLVVVHSVAGFQSNVICCWGSSLVREKRPSRNVPLHHNVLWRRQRQRQRQHHHSSPAKILRLTRSDTAAAAAAKDSSSSSSSSSRLVDEWLAKLTTAFPIFVLSAALLAVQVPRSLLWVNTGNTVTVMLAAVMCGTGLTLQTKDFERIWEIPRNRLAIPLGVLCQFIIMPASAYLVGQSVLSTSLDVNKNALFLGLCLVGCSPGGTASNLVSLIAGADVALSVVLTSCSTLVMVVLTPLLVKLLVQSTVQVSGMALCSATAKVILVPVVLGMALKSKAPKVADFISRFTPFASVILVALICGGVVAQTAPLLASSGCLRLLLSAVVGLHSLGFLAGYFIPKAIVNERSARTICIEVGMQNSALAVVLARSIGAHPAASLPGALSATVHSCLGSLLAAYWRIRNNASSSND